MTEHDPLFPNIERPAHLKPFELALWTLQATRPDLMDAWRQSVAGLMPEMTALLQKKNDTPEAITPADVERMAILTTAVRATLDELLNANR